MNEELIPCYISLPTSNRHLWARLGGELEWAEKVHVGKVHVLQPIGDVEWIAWIKIEE